MRILSALPLFLVASLTGFSQEKSFDLNKYKFPDYKRHLLELTLTSQGYNSLGSRYEPVNNTVITQDVVHSDNKSHLNLNYQYDYLTRKRMYNLTSSVSGDYNYSLQRLGNDKTTDSNTQIYWNLNGFRRYYLIEKKFFLEGNTALNYNFRRRNQTVPYGNPDDYFRSHSGDISVGLGVGSGRIEKVNDLWQANYILDKLNQQNSLSRQPSEKDIYEFAELASKLKNKRILDFRTKRIYELQMLDSLLHQQGLIEESDISYFTTLNDYWSYGNFQKRESGTELKLWVAPNYSYGTQKINNQDDSNHHYSRLTGYLALDSKKQLNLLWERRFIATVFYNETFDVTRYYGLVYPDTDINTNASIGYGFFPNSRTHINGDLTYFGRNMVDYKSHNNQVDRWINRVALSLKGYYYFLPHLQLSTYCSLDYEIGNSSTFDHFSINYAFALSYFIF